MNIEQLGPYCIGRKLGRGGMGTVYEGTDANTGHRAAVKVLAPALADEEGFRDRFKTEIETLKRLKHPNIVQLLAWGEDDGHLFYAMELVEGTTLEEELQAGRRFDWREVIQFGIKLCKALRLAHDYGITHRDIKPANLLLTRDGELKLSDFGIARLFGNARLTADGGLIGTAEYMAPEQADGRIVTNACDLYSMGCVMFALLAGRPPFQSHSLPEMLQMQRFTDPPPLSRFASDVPEELEQIVHRLLEKDPRRRPANAAVLGRQLAATEYGLSMFARDEAAPHDETRVANASDVALVEDSVGGGAEHQDPLALTRPIAPPTSASGGGNNSATIQLSGEASLPRSEPPPRVNRFTTLAEDEAAARRAAEQAAAGQPVALQAGLLSALLLIIVGVLYMVFRPPTADKLFDRIAAEVSEGTTEKLHDADEDIASFLARFPNDPRITQINGYKSQIEQVRFEKQLRGQAKQRLQAQETPPVQRDYLEAMALAESNPQQAIARLRALLDVYPAGNDGATRHTLDLAAKDLHRLQAEVDRNSAERLKLLQAQLDRADTLRAAEPEKAQAIWRGVIELYASQPWAAGPVAQARERLK